MTLNQIKQNPYFSCFEILSLFFWNIIFIFHYCLGVLFSSYYCFGVFFSFHYCFESIRPHLVRKNFQLYPKFRI